MTQQSNRFFKFSNWSMHWKMSLMPFMSVIFVLIGLLFLLPYVNGKLVDEKREAPKSVVDTAFNLISECDIRAQKGEFTLEEAKQKAKERIKICATVITTRSMYG